jgi:hypothetical protein
MGSYIMFMRRGEKQREREREREKEKREEEERCGIQKLLYITTITQILSCCSDHHI